MDFSGPDAIDKAIEVGLDLDGSPIPLERKEREEQIDISFLVYKSSKNG